MSKTNKYPLYRLAVYGRSAAGKTCYLAALAMMSEVSRSGSTCTWIPRPRAEGYSFAVDKKAGPIYAASADRLSKSIHALENGSVPEPNELNAGDLRFLFLFTAPGREPFLVETIDYSGELVDPDVSEGALADQLRKHLQNMDGLIVLAEAPREGAESQELHSELLRLEQALALLAKDSQRQRLGRSPILLAVNKWDRLGSLVDAELGTEAERLQQQLDSQNRAFSGHARLSRLIAAVAPEGGSACRPVSAFGETVVDALGAGFVERPKYVRPIRSFGIEEAIVELIDLKDRLDLAAIHSTTGRASGLALWDPAAIRTIGPNIGHVAKRFGKREGTPLSVPGADEPLVPKKVFGRARSKRVRVGVSQVAGLALVAVAGQQGYQVHQDYDPHTAWRTVDNQIQRATDTRDLSAMPDLQQIKAQEDWICAYHEDHQPILRFSSYLALVSHDYAGERCTAAANAREAILGDALEQQREGSEERARAAEAYLATFGEAGPRSQAALISRNLFNWANQIETAGIEAGQLDAALGRYETDGEAHSSRFESISQSASDITLPSIPEAENGGDIYDPLRANVSELQALISTIVSRANAEAHRRKCAESWRDIESRMASGNFEGASEAWLTFSQAECSTDGRGIGELPELIRGAVLSYAQARSTPESSGEASTALGLLLNSELARNASAADEKLLEDLNEAQAYLARLAEAAAYSRLQRAWATWDPLEDSRDPLYGLFDAYNATGRVMFGAQVDAAQNAFLALEGPQDVEITWSTVYADRFESYYFNAYLKIGDVEFGPHGLNYDGGDRWRYTARINRTRTVTFESTRSHEPIFGRIVTDRNRTHGIGINNERDDTESARNLVVTLADLRDGHTIQLNTGAQFKARMTAQLTNSNAFTLVPLPPQTTTIKRPEWFNAGQPTTSSSEQPEAPIEASPE